MRELLRIRDFRLLWTAQAISNVGDGITNLALLITAQRLTGSTAAVAITAIAIALPTLLFGMVAGAYVDRWNRKRVMIISDFFRTLFVLGFVFVTDESLMWMLYIVAFIQATLSTFFTPAKSAYLPRIVGEERLLEANSVSQITQVISQLAGTAIAGLIAGVAGTMAPAFLADAGSFVLSLIALTLIRTDAEPHRVEEPSTIITDIRVGLRTVLGSPILRGVMVAATVLMFGVGATNVLMVPFVIDILGVAETWFAAIEGAQVVAMVISAGLVATLAARIRPTSLIGAGMMALGLLIMAISLVSVPLHLMVIAFLLGSAVAPVQASISTLVQSEVSDFVRGRTSSALSTVTTAANVASMAIAGTLAALIGVRGVFVVSGVVAIVAGLVAFALFRTATAEHSPVPEPGVAGR